MDTPLRITFRDMAPSAALDAAIRARVEWLEHHHPRLTSCHVVVEALHERQHGAGHAVRIELGVPGGETIGAHSALDRTAHADCVHAIRDAFHAARRQLDELARRRLGAKHHHAVGGHA